MKLDRGELLRSVVAQLRCVAPEVEADSIDPARSLRSQVDLDSMDWLNFLIGLHERFGVNVAESDYAGLVTLDDVINYLQSNVAHRPQ